MKKEFFVGGYSEEAFSTLADAVEAARQAEGECVIKVAPGEYSFSEGLTLDQRDSGLELTAPDGGVTVTGGKRLRSADFSPITDPVTKARLDADAAEHVLMCDLGEFGITPEIWGPLHPIGRFGTSSRYDNSTSGINVGIYCNGKRMTLARYPNGNEFLKFKAIHDVGECAEFPPTNYYHENVKLRNPRPGKYVLDIETNKRIMSWASYDGIWMYGYFFHDWADASTPIKEFDTAHRAIIPEYVAHYGAREGGTYFFYNVFDELDEPGEWFYDRSTGILYVYPYEDGDFTVDIALADDTLITSDGADGIVIDGFDFTCARRGAISVKADSCAVRNCRITNVNDTAISVVGYGNVIEKCELSQLASGGISVSGGERTTLTRGNNTVRNNRISNYAEINRVYSAGISLGGVGNTAAYNLISYAPHMAIFYGGNDHLIEYNRIHHVCLESSDAGAVYAGRDWTGQGSVVRFNYIHDIGAGEFTPDALYWDDAMSGQCAYGNLIMYVEKFGALIGGGRDNIFRDNIVIRAKWPLWYDARAREGAVEDGWFREHVKKDSGDLWTRLAAMPTKSKVWAERYPTLARVSDDFEHTDDPDFGPNPAYSTVRDNILIGEKYYINEYTERQGEVENNYFATLNGGIPAGSPIGDGALLNAFADDPSEDNFIKWINTASLSRDDWAKNFAIWASLDK